MARNVFAGYVDQIYPYKFAGEIQIEKVMGGTPSDSKVAEGWLRTKLGISKEQSVADAVAVVMEARAGSVDGPISQDDALKEVDQLRHLNGFCRDENGLYLEGRHLKAGIKEGASAARAVGNLDARFGLTKKGTLSFIAEHIIVVEDRLYLYQLDPATGKAVNVTAPSGVRQSFPKNPITNQTGIQYSEYVDNAIVAFTIMSDWEFTEMQWATILLTSSYQGIGASRSQSFGRYTVTKWDPIGTKK
jgi:hypothetical protein